MQNIMRVSVRGLVEFTLHGEDIYPTGGALRDMQEGALGHKARQALLGEGWQAEVPLSLTVPADDDGGELMIAGRMAPILFGSIPALLTIVNVIGWIITLWVVAITIWSGVDYFQKNFDVIRNAK